jgi:hypothetical protein
MNAAFDVATSGIEVDRRSDRNRSKNFKGAPRSVFGIAKHSQENIPPKRNARHVPLRYVE